MHFWSWIERERQSDIYDGIIEPADVKTFLKLWMMAYSQYCNRNRVWSTHNRQSYCHNIRKMTVWTKEVQAWQYRVRKGGCLYSIVSGDIKMKQDSPMTPVIPTPISLTSERFIEVQGIMLQVTFFPLTLKSLSSRRRMFYVLIDA